MGNDCELTLLTMKLNLEMSVWINNPGIKFDLLDKLPNPNIETECQAKGGRVG